MGWAERDFRLYHDRDRIHSLIPVMFYETKDSHRGPVARFKAIAPFLPAILLVAWPLVRSLF